MALPGEMLGKVMRQGEASGVRFPPTLFVHMARDARTARAVAEDVQVLAKTVRADQHFWVC